ncbi:MAG: hypothetical protein EU541_02035 [Promethearchaeota archaeon]|nr:MAG: hypothetical protein EU541_02035 [Candidatus Lokiarchaeota archaeon]
MARYYLYILRILNAFLFIWIVFIFLTLFDFNAVLVTAENQFILVDVIETLFNLLSYALYGFLYLVVIILIALFALHFIWISSPQLFSIIALFFNKFLGMWFSFPGGNAPNVIEIPALMFDELMVLTEEIYLLVFSILFILSIIYVIKGLFNSDPENNMKAIKYLVLMIVVPLIIFGFIDMLRLLNAVEFFNSLDIINLNELEDPLSPLFNQLPINDIFGFFGSAVTLFAILSYIFLEFTFQINYVDQVTNPSLKRSKRLETQLSLLRKESISITANVEKVKEEAEKRKEELGLEKEKITKFMQQKEEKLSYIKEMIERKKLEMEEQKLVRAASKTRRLGRYVDKLFRQDPEAEDALTASSSAPRAKSLIISTVLNSIFRISVLVIFSFIIIHPQIFLQFLPPAMTESIAMYSPEIIILLLIPIILLFPIIAKTIGYVRQRSLIIQIKQEEKVQEIMASVGDYVKKEEAEDETVEEQTDVEVEETIT